MSEAYHPICHNHKQCYPLIFVTFGVYGFYWMHRMIKDINALNGSTAFDLPKIIRRASHYAVIYSALFVLCLVSLARGGSTASSLSIALCLLVWLMAMGWAVAVLRLVSRMAKTISALQAKRGMKQRASSRLAIILFIFNFAGLPYLQLQLNSLVSSSVPAKNV